MTRPPDDLPGSAKLVYLIVEQEDGCRRETLREHYGIADSTITDAVSTLEERDLIERDRSTDPNDPVFRTHAEIRHERGN